MKYVVVVSIVAWCSMVTKCYGQTAADTSQIIHWVEQAIVHKNDVTRQDSLLRLAMDRSTGAELYDYQMRIYQLHSFLKQMQNDLALAEKLAVEAVQTGIRHPDLQQSISFHDAITNLALCYTYTDKRDSLLQWIRRGKKLCKGNDHFNYSVLLSLEAIASVHVQPDAHVEALFDSAIMLAKTTANPHDDIMAVFNKSEVLRAIGGSDWGKSIELLTSVQDIIDDPALTRFMPRINERIAFFYRNARTSLYHSLSSAYFLLSDADNACYYQELIVNDYKERNNLAYLPYVWCDLAEYETFRGNRKKVAHIYDSALLLIRQHYKKESIPFPSFYYVAGWLAEQDREFNQAAAHYAQATVAAAPLLHVSLPALLRVFTQARKIKEADSLVQAVKTRPMGHDAFLNVLYHKELAAYYTLKNNMEPALYHRMEHYRLKDSLAMAARYYLVREVETRFKTKEKEKELYLANKTRELQKNELRQKQWTIIYLSAGVTLLVALCFVLYQFYRSRKRQALELSRKNDQIETLIRELHHRVKNNLQTISSLLSLQSFRSKDPGTKLALKENQSRIEAMALIHQKLYINDNLRGVDMEEYLKDLVNSLAESYGFDTQIIKTEIALTHEKMDVDMAIPLGLIINELVVNAFKYAFDQVSDPEVIVSLKDAGGHGLELMVRDNGKGMPEAAKSGNSFGLKMVQTLARQLNATFTVKNERGAVFQLLMDDGNL